MSLKKIIPNEPPNTLVLDDNFQRQQSVKNLNFKELKKNTKYTDARHNVKKQAIQQEFINLITEDLELYGSDDGKYDTQLILRVCNIAEDFFTQYKKMGEIKKNAVIEVLKPYFNNDVLLLSNLVDDVYPQILKSNFFRRNKKKVFKLFGDLFKFFFNNQ